MTRLPLTADSDCPHCHGLGVVMVAVYVPVELLRAGGNPVPGERKLCRCVGAGAREQSATQLEGGGGGWSRLPPLPSPPGDSAGAGAAVAPDNRAERPPHRRLGRQTEQTEKTNV